MNGFTMVWKTWNSHTVAVAAVFYLFSIFILIPTTEVFANESNNSSTNDNFTDDRIDVPPEFIPVTESAEFSKGTTGDNETTLLVAKTTVNDTASDGEIKVMHKNESISKSSNNDIKMKVDIPKRTMDFDIVFPQLSISGVYEVSGNLFFFPIGGNGNFYFNLGGTRAKGVSKLSVFRNSTHAQVFVKRTDVSLEIETIKVHLTNLFNGYPLLGTFINTFLNENSQEVFAEVKPQIGTQLGEMLSLLANQALSALSTSQFDEFPFSPSPEDKDDDVNGQAS